MPSFQLSDFDYALPPELIASFPAEDRTSARLLHVSRESGKFSHHVFRDLPQFLRPGDLLVLNNTRVLRARLYGVRDTGGKVEALLLKKIDDNKWEALLRPGKRIKKGARIVFGENGTRLESFVLDDGRPDSGQRLIEFRSDRAAEALDQIGHVPLPPYLSRRDTPEDRELYQTVFADKEGAVASPTAGLHFNKALLDEVRAAGVEVVFVTLHTGYGTFQPITEQDIMRGRLFSEDYEISEAAAGAINRAVREQRRVIACGTTSVRTLESAAREDGCVKPGKNSTQIFIYPPYRFKTVSGLITNFHVPKSSLLMLAAAFLQTPGTDGREKLMNIYSEAIRQKYRFYSYGDAMVIL